METSEKLQIEALSQATNQNNKDVLELYENIKKGKNYRPFAEYFN